VTFMAKKNVRKCRNHENGRKRPPDTLWRGEKKWGRGEETNQNRGDGCLGNRKQDENGRPQRPQKTRKRGGKKRSFNSKIITTTRKKKRGKNLPSTGGKTGNEL